MLVHQRVDIRFPVVMVGYQRGSLLGLKSRVSRADFSIQIHKPIIQSIEIPHVQHIKHIQTYCLKIGRHKNPMVVPNISHSNYNQFSQLGIYPIFSLTFWALSHSIPSKYISFYSHDTSCPIIIVVVSLDVTIYITIFCWLNS